MEITRLFDFVVQQLNEAPQAKCISYKPEGSTTWKSYSTQEIWDMSVSLAGGLLNLGLQPGDKVASVVYKNRPEWAVCDLAMQMIGVINVPVYPTISSNEYEFIFNDASVQYCFVGSGDLFQKVQAAQANVPTFKGIYVFDEAPNRTLWTSLFDASQKDRVLAASEKVKTSDIATYIYTSGTTGNPKGVVLTHSNIVSNVLAVSQLIPATAGERTLSFLPLCHIFEKAILYGYFALCTNIYFTGTDNLGGEEGDLKAVQPHFFSTVPRLLEKVYEKIYNKGLDLKGIKRSLFFWALRQTENYEYDSVPGLKMKIADKLIFSKWREALGGHVKGIITGAAPCPRKIAQVFSAAGIPVREGYGLTESSPAITVNRFNNHEAMLGTVGPLVDGVEVKIDNADGLYGPGEGEILATGPNIMQEYYRNSEATAATLFEENGKIWLRTGDIGTFVKGRGGVKFLKITDRKKELLKTSGGKYVAPAPIESKLKESFLIEQMMVVGDGQKFVSAIICPAPDALKEWCTRHDLTWTTIEAAVKEPTVIKKYQEIIDESNHQFSHVEQIKKFTLSPHTWEPVKADGSAAELTPTMKLKRRVVREKYAAEIAAMYA